MKKNLKTLVDATSTPLASIFGSGFLVIVPILAGAVGLYSVAAMAGVCALVYAVGSVIRYNIKHAEPVLVDKPSEMTLSFERLSDIALVLAYVISVCLYLHILASFVLGSFHTDTELNKHLVTTGILVVIMVIAGSGGSGVLGFWGRTKGFWVVLGSPIKGRPRYYPGTLRASPEFQAFPKRANGRFKQP